MLDKIANEVLFYDGLVGISVTVIIAIILFITGHIHLKHLNRCFDEEYGERN